MLHGLAAVLLAGCSPLAPIDVQVTVDADVPTVIHVSWTTEEATTSWVEYRPVGGAASTLSTPKEGPSTTHEFHLLGVPALTDVEIRAVSQLGEDKVEAEAEAATGGMPSSLPDIQVSSYDPALADPFRYLVGSVWGQISTVYAIDRQGRWFWWHEADPEELIVEVDFEEGTGNLLFNTFSEDFSQDLGTIRRVSFDGEVNDTLRTEMGHHSFAQLPEGALAWLAVDVRDWYDAEEDATVPVVGDQVVVQPVDGEPYTLFSTWDWAEPYKHDRWNLPFYDLGHDWTHANKLTYRADTHTLLVSLAWIDTILEIDAATGEVLRSFGDFGTYAYAEGTTEFALQHDPNWTDDGTLLMTASLGRGARDEIIAIEYAVDDLSETITEVWSYGRGQDLGSVAEGMARKLPSGNVLVSWGINGITREVTPAGEVAWELSLAVGAGFGYAQTFSDFYAP